MSFKNVVVFIHLMCYWLSPLEPAVGVADVGPWRSDASLAVKSIHSLSLATAIAAMIIQGVVKNLLNVL